VKSRKTDLFRYTGASRTQAEACYSKYETGDIDRRTHRCAPTISSLRPQVSSLILIVLSTILIFCFAISARPDETKTVFYDYSANKMDFDRKNGVTILEGDAKLKVRDSEDYLNADKVTIYRDVKTGELIRMEAVGNVDMNQEGMKATCERAIFHETENRIELEGVADSPAIVDDGKNRMEAPRITFFRKENRIEASGNVSGHVTIKERTSGTPEESEDKGEE
jgi:lipopolysaccharide transport protein LptA